MSTEATAVTSIADLEAAAAPTKTRAVYTYNVPEGISGADGAKKVGLVELEAGEEMLATRRSGGDQIKLAFTLAQESLRYVDGKKINTGDGSSERAWAALNAKTRQLVLAAYSQIHNPKEVEQAGFLTSCQVTVG